MQLARAGLRGRELTDKHRGMTLAAEVPGRWSVPGWRAFSRFLRALLVTIAFAAALVPILARNGFDPSVFIMAGDQHVDAAKTPSAIVVKRNSTGYDGAFYYRLAIDPFTSDRTAHGVTLDNPQWRMQRIVYPLATWLASGGNAWLVPWALLVVNLLGLGAIAYFAQGLTERLGLWRWTPLLIMCWPGFIVTLTYDTTEILATALLLAALGSYYADRMVRFAALGALASLTRETCVLVLGCIAAFEVYKGAVHRDQWDRIAICALTLVPFLAWRQAQFHIWGQYPQTSDIGMLAVGLYEAVVHSFNGLRSASRHEVVTLVALLGFTGAVSYRAGGPLRAIDRQFPIAMGWLLITALMLTLRADGPWINSTAYLRALTEWFVVGCLLLGTIAPRHFVAAGFATMLAAVWAFNWIICMTQASLR